MRIGALILYLAALTTTAPAQAAAAQSPLTPAWRVLMEDPSTLQAMKSVIARRFGFTLREDPLGGVAFTVGGQVVTYALVPVVPKLTVSPRVPVSAVHVALSVRDGASGGELVSADWVSALTFGAAFTRLAPLSGGLILQTSDLIRLLSNRLEPLQVLHLPASDPGPGPNIGRTEPPWILVTPSGKQGLIAQDSEGPYVVRGNTLYPGPDRARDCRVDGSTLSVRCQFVTDPPVLDAISDTLWLHHNQKSYFVADAWTVATNPRWLALKGGTEPAFTDADHILLCGPQPKPNVWAEPLLLAGLDGSVRTLVPFAKGETACLLGDRKESVSWDGAFAAVEVSQFHAPRLWWDSFPKVKRLRVEVLDLHSGAIVGATDWAAVPQFEWDFALSPDGSRLALLDDGELCLYELPRPARLATGP